MNEKKLIEKTLVKEKTLSTNEKISLLEVLIKDEKEFAKFKEDPEDWCGTYRRIIPVKPPKRKFPIPPGPRPYEDMWILNPKIVEILKVTNLLDGGVKTIATDVIKVL